METLVQPKPATVSFRDRLRRGAVKKAADNKVTIHLPIEETECGNYLMVRIPKNMPFSEVRTKDAFTDEAGKYHKDAAMLTVNAMPVKGVDTLFTFLDEENNTRLEMPCRGGLTFNVSLAFSEVKLFDAETGDPIEDAA